MPLFQRKIVLTILFFFPMVSWAQHKHGTPNYLSSDGQLTKDFWKTVPDQCIKTPKFYEKVVFHENGITKEILNFVRLHESQFGSIEFGKAENDLMKVLNVHGYSSPSVGIKDFNERIFLFFYQTNYYLVDKNKDTAYLLDESGSGNFLNEIVQAEKITEEYGYGEPLENACDFSLGAMDLMGVLQESLVCLFLTLI